MRTAPNRGLELTASSVRCAPTYERGSGPALDAIEKQMSDAGIKTEDVRWQRNRSDLLVHDVNGRRRSKPAPSIAQFCLQPRVIGSFTRMPHHSIKSRKTTRSKQ